MKQWVLHVSPDDSRHLFPSNRSTDFTVQLGEGMQLSEESFVELLEISCVIDGKYNRDSLCIMSDLCGQLSFLFGREAPLLRVVPLISDRKRLSVEFNSPQRLRCRSGFWKQCSFHIRDRRFETPSFSISELQLSLRITNVLSDFV